MGPVDRTHRLHPLVRHRRRPGTRPPPSSCGSPKASPAGGETAGASALTVELAPDNRRATYGSWTMNGIAAGFVLAGLVFLPISCPTRHCTRGGWRVPFWSSVLVLLLAYFVRRTLAEPEVFQEARHRKARAGCRSSRWSRTTGGMCLRLAACAPVHHDQHHRLGVRPRLRHRQRRPGTVHHAVGHHRRERGGDVHPDRRGDAR
ncbi:MFS transporter [Streptomyces sp. KL116D]|uniref:MFS transporter n=1 Tax=Streptomyces sp. KL116D TaxID=3045152 RepID=UPI00355616C9